MWLDFTRISCIIQYVRLRPDGSRALRLESSAIRQVEMMSLDFRVWHEFVIETELNKLYHLVSLEGINASALYLSMSLNGLHETHRTWIQMLIYPFMHGAWMKGASDRCSVDMTHHGGRHHGFESVLWPLRMSAPACRSIPSLTTSKPLIKLKWFKNNDDKYLWMAVLHGPTALRGLQCLNLHRFQAVHPLPSVSPLPFSCPAPLRFTYPAWNREFHNLT